MSAALTPPATRADDASLSSAPSRQLPLVSVNSAGEEIQLESESVAPPAQDMDVPAIEPSGGEQQPNSQAAVAPGSISEQGSNAHDDSGGDVVMEGTAEPEELSQQQQSLSSQQGRQQQQQQQQQEGQAEHREATPDNNESGDDDQDDAASQASSEYEHRYFLEGFQEDTSVPTEEELPEMQRRAMDEVSALDQDHWVKTSFTQLPPFPDPEYQIMPEIYQLKWAMHPFHGTQSEPNKEPFTRSSTITVTNHSGRKFHLNLKVFPHGNDGTEMVSVYVECSPISEEAVADNGQADKSWWELPAQLGCLAYNESDPRVYAFQKAAHQFTSINPDFGWTRFAGPWSELHKRKHLQTRPLLQTDRLAFVLYVRLVNDSTRALWYHNVQDHRNDWDPVLKTGYRGYHLEFMPTGYSAIISALAVWLEMPTFRHFLDQITLPDTYASPLEGYQTLALALKRTLHDKLAPKSSGASNRITYLDNVYTALVKHGSQTFLNPFQVWSSLLEILREEMKEASNRENSNGASDLEAFACSVKLIEYPIEPRFPTCTELEDRTDTEQTEMVEDPPSAPVSAQEVIALAAGAVSAEEHSVPDILHLELPRHAFDPELRRWKKVTTKIEIDYVVMYKGQHYQLFGMITHSGELGNTRFNPVLRPRGPGSQWLRWSTRCNNTTRGYVVPQTQRQAVESHQGSTTSSTVAYIVVYVRREALHSMIDETEERRSHDVYNPLPALNDQVTDLPSHFRVAVHSTSAFHKHKSKMGFINPWSTDSGALTIELRRDATILDLRNKICATPDYHGKQIVLYRLLMNNSNHRYDPQVREDRLETRVLLHSLHSVYGVHFLLHELSGEHAAEATQQHKQLSLIYEQDRERNLDAEAAKIMAEKEQAYRELTASRPEAVNDDNTSTDIAAAAAAAANAVVAEAEAIPPEASNNASTPPPAVLNTAPVDDDVIMSGTEETEEGEEDLSPAAEVTQATQGAAGQAPVQTTPTGPTGIEPTEGEPTPSSNGATDGTASSEAVNAPPEPKVSVQLMDAVQMDGRPCPAQLISCMDPAGRDLLSGLLGRHLMPDEGGATFAARYAGDDVIRFFSLLPRNPSLTGPTVGQFTLVAMEPVAFAATWQKPVNHALIFVKHYYPKGPELLCSNAMLVPRSSILKEVLKRPNSTAEFVCYLEQIEGPPTQVRKDGSLMDNDIATGCVLITDPVMEGLMATTLTKRGLPSSVIDYLNPQAGFTTGFGRGWAKCETKSNRAHGSGRVIYPNGDAYEGQFVSGHRQGKGTMHFANGNSYKGTWVDDEPSGVGVIVYSSTANKYEGPFKDGRPHGSGGVTYWKKAEAGARICRICLDEEMNSVLIPCGHMVVCMGCGEHLRDCPVCRTGIDRLQRVWDCSQA